MLDVLKASYRLDGRDIGAKIHVKYHESDFRGTLTAVTHTTGGSLVQVESQGTTWQVPLAARDLVVVGAGEDPGNDPVSGWDLDDYDLFSADVQEGPGGAP